MSSSSETLRTCGIDEAFEVATVEYCADAVKSGREMTLELMIEGMRAALRQQMTLLDNPEAIRLVADRIWCALQGPTPTKRVLTDAERAAWPADGRSLLEKHFPR
jgi:hypothetical protein